MNHKRVYRLYCLEGLRMRPKRPRRHVSSQRREVRPLASQPDERWAMDFMSDELFDGRRIRLLTIVDHFTRESLATLVDGRLGGQRVVEVLARLALGGRKPRTISMDNGPEFTSKRLDQCIEWGRRRQWPDRSGWSAPSPSPNRTCDFHRIRLSIR